MTQISVWENGYVLVKRAALKKGCDVCRGHIVMLLADTPRVVDFLCPKCEYHWKLTRGAAA